MSQTVRRPQPPQPPRRGASRGLWIAILVLLAPAVVIPLWVPLYDRADPALFGFPFYFWFQFALILLAAVVTSAAFVLSRVADQRDHQARDTHREAR